MAANEYAHESAKRDRPLRQGGADGLKWRKLPFAGSE